MFGSFKKALKELNIGVSGCIGRAIWLVQTTAFGQD